MSAALVQRSGSKKEKARNEWWDDRDRRARCTSRNGMDDTHRENEIGFRVALTLEE